MEAGLVWLAYILSLPFIVMLALKLDPNK